MPSWTCPNLKCTYDKRLEPGQHCPLCGEEAKGFSFTEFGDVLKQKWSFKKSAARSRGQEEILRRIKFCPKCGSTNISFPIFYRPSIWKCLNCGYEGSLIVEDGDVAKEIRRHYREQKKKTKQEP